MMPSRWPEPAPAAAPAADACLWWSPPAAAPPGAAVPSRRRPPPSRAPASPSAPPGDDAKPLWRRCLAEPTPASAPPGDPSWADSGWPGGSGSSVDASRSVADQQAPAPAAEPAPAPVPGPASGIPTRRTLLSATPPSAGISVVDVGWRPDAWVMGSLDAVCSIGSAAGGSEAKWMNASSTSASKQGWSVALPIRHEEPVRTTSPMIPLPSGNALE
mmetsp:Transcript_3636/g.15137  ORF Transcript_3636/g.15137 Transcript_3636/m.15137 type:complete len:216 (-) Transcript_3636:1704-2351(-)